MKAALSITGGFVCLFLGWVVSESYNYILLPCFLVIIIELVFQERGYSRHEERTLISVLPRALADLVISRLLRLHLLSCTCHAGYFQTESNFFILVIFASGGFLCCMN